VNRFAPPDEARKETPLTAFWTALLIVFLAELGDKTQLLVMAFAVRYRPWTVFAGALAASAVTHLLAVAAGGALTAVVPLETVRLAASLAFIAFGAWTLWPERDDEGDGQAQAADKPRFSPFWAVAGAFFLAEMGDKTQLASMALAAEYAAPLPVWLGAVLAMAAVDGVAIVAGVLLHKRVPEKAVKRLAGVAFIAFGVWGLLAG
jgi:Ca2+/H+ antiporter, TMEM165/GDT1 family